MDISPEPVELFLHDFAEQDSARRFLWRAYRTERIASTYLFAGPAGIGKFLASLRFAKFLKCPNNSAGAACDYCRSCRTIELWDNPDILIIFPMPLSVWESDERERVYRAFHKKPHIRPEFTRGAQILIPMIREIQRFFATASTSIGGKFVLMPDAHKMNRQAGNAFLKTLEEPPADTHIILSTDRAEALLPTIRSRAQLVRFRRLATNDVMRHLMEEYSLSPEISSLAASLSGGSIAKALKISGDEFQQIRRCAAQLIERASVGDLCALWDWASSAQAKNDYANALTNALISFVRDIIVSTAQSGPILNTDSADIIVDAAKRIGSPFAAMILLKEIHKLKMELARNPQYAIFYSAIAATVARAFLK